MICKELDRQRYMSVNNNKGPENIVERNLPDGGDHSRRALYIFGNCSWLVELNQTICHVGGIAAICTLLQMEFEAPFAPGWQYHGTVIGIWERNCPCGITSTVKTEFVLSG
jgi:hypothetical protein